MQVLNVLYTARWKYRTQNDAKNRHLRTIAQRCQAYIFATKASIDNRKKLVKQQYLLHKFPQYGELQPLMAEIRLGVLHMFSQYGELRPISGWDLFVSLGHPSKSQRVSHLGFVTAATSLTGGQPNLARRLAVSWTGALFIYFLGLSPPDGMLPGANLQTSLCVQNLLSPTLAALLHGTRAVGVSQNLRRATRNGVMVLSQTAPPIFGCAAITLGIAPNSSLIEFLCDICCQIR